MHRAVDFIRPLQQGSKAEAAAAVVPPMLIPGPLMPTPAARRRLEASHVGLAFWDRCNFEPKSPTMGERTQEYVSLEVLHLPRSFQTNDVVGLLQAATGHTCYFARVKVRHGEPGCTAKVMVDPSALDAMLHLSEQLWVRSDRAMFYLDDRYVAEEFFELAKQRRNQLPQPVDDNECFELLVVRPHPGPSQPAQ